MRTPRANWWEVEKMPKSPVRAFQESLCPKLTTIFPGVPVAREWAAMVDERGLYSPRLDIAVGPFASGTQVYVEEFEHLVREHEDFLCRLYECHLANLSQYGGLEWGTDFVSVTAKNPNARCFLAIEIENEVSRKHLMGGAINAAALGRIGIAVGWTPEKVKAFVRLRSYLLFLARVGKNTFDPTNLLVLTKDQMQDAIDSFAVDST